MLTYQEKIVCLLITVAVGATTILRQKPNDISPHVTSYQILRKRRSQSTILVYLDGSEYGCLFYIFDRFSSSGSLVDTGAQIIVVRFHSG